MQNLSQVVFTSRSDLNCYVVISNEKVEENIISKICEKSTKETSYRIGEIVNPRKNHKYHKKRPKVEEQIECDKHETKKIITYVTMEKVARIIANEEVENVLLIFRDLFEEFNVEFRAEHENLYIAGRYLKYSRQLPQTPWIMNGKRHFSPTSVEEIISAPLQELYVAWKCVLSSSGREDVDVRTLGNGRPFILEIQCPRRLPTSKELQKAAEVINSNTEVGVLDTCEVKKEATKTLLEGETSKTKCYRAYCFSKNKTIESHDLKKLNLIEVILNAIYMYSEHIQKYYNFSTNSNSELPYEYYIGGITTRERA